MENRRSLLYYLYMFLYGIIVYLTVYGFIKFVDFEHILMYIKIRKKR